jgi:hypothetical protein
MTLYGCQIVAPAFGWEPADYEPQLGSQLLGKKGIVMKGLFACEISIGAAHRHALDEIHPMALISP